MYTQEALLSPADLKHLKLLTIGHYVLAGLSAVYSCIFLIHIAIGIGMIMNPGTASSGIEGGWLFLVIGLVMMTFGWTYAAMVAFAGKALQMRKRRMFVLVVAGISCLNMPLGLILAILTFMVLLRPSVAAAFDGRAMMQRQNASAIESLDLGADLEEEFWKDFEEKAKAQKLDASKDGQAIQLENAVLPEKAKSE